MPRWTAVEQFLTKGVSFFAQAKPEESVLDKLWAEEVRFECQVSCVWAKASCWVCKPHHLSPLQSLVYHHLAHSWKLLRAVGTSSSLFFPSLKASEYLLSQLCCCLHVSLEFFSPCKGYPCFFLDKVCQSAVFDPLELKCQAGREQARLLD